MCQICAHTTKFYLCNVNIHCNCNKIVRIPHFMSDNAHLQNITFDMCHNLKSLSNLPSILRYLQISDCPNLDLESIQTKNLESLRLDSLPVTVFRYPFEKLMYLNIVSCQHLTQIPKLPDNLGTLILEDLPSIKHLPEFPTELKGLHIRNTSLVTIPKLPDTVSSLTITDCKCMYGILDISSVKTLHFGNNCILLVLTGFNNLLYLELYGKNYIFSDKIPENIAYLEYTDCYDIFHIPKLPTRLEVFKIRDCPNIISIPKIPEKTNFETYTPLPNLSIIDNSDYYRFPSFYAEMIRENYEKYKTENTRKNIRNIGEELISRTCIPSRIHSWYDLEELEYTGFYDSKTSEYLNQDIVKKY